MRVSYEQLIPQFRAIDPSLQFSHTVEFLLVATLGIEICRRFLGNCGAELIHNGTAVDRIRIEVLRSVSFNATCCFILNESSIENYAGVLPTQVEVREAVERVEEIPWICRCTQRRIGKTGSKMVCQ